MALHRKMLGASNASMDLPKQMEASEMRTASGMGCSGWSRGDLRLVKRTCLVPRCIDGCWCWLTPLYVVQEYRPFTSHGPDMPSYPSYKWGNKRWSIERPEGTFFVAEMANPERFVKDSV